MDTFELLLGIVLCFFAFYYILMKRNKTNSLNLPPSPWGNLPVLGHFLRLGTEPHKTFLQWTQQGKYPPVISVQFGSIPSVVISDVKLLKEALNESSFAGRPNLKFLSDRSGGTPRGIIFTEGQVWSDLRRFSMRHLRDFGFGKKSMEARVLEEVADLIHRLKKDMHEPLNTRKVFNAAVINALWAIIAGERFKHDDPELDKILDMLIASFERNGIAAMTMFIPWLPSVAPKLSGYEQLMRETEEFFVFIQKHIDNHQQTFQPGECRDFIDAFLQETHNTSDPTSVFHSSNSDLKYVLGDLFIAGAETTSTTLSWAFLYLAKFPEVQQKLHEEIDAVIGSSRLPSLSDRPSMDYTNAVIHEVLRYSTIAPLAFFHSTTADVTFASHTIPKGTMFVPNIYAAHFDKDAWGDPQHFRPERFIQPETKKFLKNDAFMAFSYGKRVCPGETLARDELFLFITSLFQTFSVSPNPTSPELDISPKLGSVLMPKPHHLKLTTRHNH